MNCWSISFWKRTTKPRAKSCWTWTPPTRRLHGQQEARFFHGYYGHYCYLPLYVFCGDHLLCARLRPSNIDASAGSLEEVQRIVRQIRARWPKTRIILRADSGFCREQTAGLVRNQRGGLCIRLRAQPALATDHRARDAPGQARAPAHGKNRRGCSASSPIAPRKSWSRARRVIAKAEQIEGKENPRYLVTSLGAQDWPAQKLYEQLYCARGEMENRIKEQLNLFADRLSTETLRANQLRLYFSSLAYVLIEALRRLGWRARSGSSASRHHPAETSENRRPGANHRAPHLGSLQLRLSLQNVFRRSLDGVALLNELQNKNLVSHSRKRSRSA